MTYRSEFISLVRAELADPAGANAVWGDGLLMAFMGDAYNGLSTDLPPVGEVTLAAVAGQTDYPLEANRVGPGGVISVQYPSGQTLRPVNSAERQPAIFPTVTGQSSWQPYEQGWELIGDFNGSGQLLRFRYPTNVAGSIVVRFYTYYVVPVTDGAVLNLNPFDEVALKWAVCERAMAWLEETRAKRQGGSVAGNRGSQGYYHRLYGAAVAARRRAMGIKVSKVVMNG